MPIYYTQEERLAFARERGILVDPQDEWLLEEYTWHVNNTDYACTNIVLEYGGEGVRRRKYTLLHHCIMGQPVNEWEEIDHINHDRTDNRRCNLRYVTKAQQNLNTTRAPGSSGHRHIYENTVGGYFVLIMREGVRYHLGTFNTLDEAAAERDEWLHNYARSTCHR